MYRSEKWWGKHDHEYIHYFYKIVNVINNKYYYGIHSIRKTDRRSKNLERDGYWGSGTELEHDKEVYGLKSFIKTVEKTFSTRREVLEYESIRVTKDIISDPLCYNVVRGGGGNPRSLGMVTVIVKDTGKSILIDKSEYEANKDKYTTAMSGKVGVKDVDGNFLIIPVEEYKNNKDKYKTVGSGFGFYKNKNDWNETQWLSVKDERVISGEYIPYMFGTKRPEVAIKIAGENNGMYGKTWITDGKENRVIDSSNTIPQGWRRGRTSEAEPATKNKRLYVNQKTKESRYFSESDLIEPGFFPSYLFDDNGDLITFERLDSTHLLCRDWNYVKTVDPLFPTPSIIKLIVKYYSEQGHTLTKITKRVTRVGQKYNKEKEFYFITNGTERILVSQNDYKSSYMNWKVLGLKDITVDEYIYIKSILKSKKKIRKTLSTSYNKIDEFLKKAGI